MTSVPFAKTSCILLPTINSDRLLQQLSGLLRSAGQNSSASGSCDNQATITDGVVQTNHVIHLLPSGLLQVGAGIKEVTLSNGGLPASVFTCAPPALITVPSGGLGTVATSTAIPPFTAGTSPAQSASVPIEVINAILRLPESVVASTSAGASLRMPAFRPVDTSSFPPAEPEGNLSTTVPSCSDSHRFKSESPSEPLPREVSSQTIPSETAHSSSLLLHRLLTGEDADRVRRRSELLLLADEARRESNEGVRSADSSRLQPATTSQDQHQSSIAKPANDPSPTITVSQLLWLLREVCQLIANQKVDTLSQTVSEQPVALNTVLLKHLLSHLTGCQGKPTVAHSNSTTTLTSTTDSMPTPPIRADQVGQVAVQQTCPPPATVVTRCPSSPPALDHVTVTPASRLQGGHTEGDLFSRLMVEEPEFTRPRSHSDHQPNRRQLLHANFDQHNHSQQAQQHHQRPRCYSKAERRCHNRFRATVAGGGSFDGRLGSSTDCDPKSSLLAKLVLTPESAWGTRTINTTTTSSSSSSPIPDLTGSSSSTVVLPPGSRRQPMTCSSTDCQQVFQWLRDSDEFVGRHCTGVPRDALLLTATTAAGAATLPRGSRAVLAKVWYQLLLICMMEKRFSFSVSPLGGLPQSTVDSQPVRSVSSNDATTARNSGHPGNGLEGDEGAGPQADGVFISQLRALIATGVGLNLGPEIYRLMRLSALAQAAYPDYYPHSYASQLSDLEAQLASATDEKQEVTASSRLVGTLRLLSQLHSIDAAILHSFFRLSTIPLEIDDTATAQRDRSERKGEEPLLKSPKPDPDSSQGHRHRGNTSPVANTNSVPTTAPGGALVGASKRKATAASRRRFGSTTEDRPQVLVTTTSTVEPTVRCRANTVSAADTGAAPGSGHVRHCKTARMS